LRLFRSKAVPMGELPGIVHSRDRFYGSLLATDDA
jgi:hypothetical protein